MSLLDYAITNNPFDGTQKCADVDPEIFFPNITDRKAVLEAKVICDSCNLIEKCLEYAVWETDLDGIWGGTTPRQRQTIRTNLRRKGVKK